LTEAMLKGGGVAVSDTPRKRLRQHSPDELTEIRCATLMQRFRSHKLATDGGKFGMTSAIARDIAFTSLSTRLRDTALIKVMKLILHRVCVLTAEGVKIYPEAQETKNVNVRVFLAAFMITHPSEEVFEDINTLESELIVAARNMLLVFDTLCISITSSKRGSDINEPVKKALSFPVVLHRYLAAFKRWKLPDEAKLTDRIKHAITALHQAEDHLVDGDADTPRLAMEFQAQEARLSKKLMEIVGTKGVQVFSIPAVCVCVTLQINNFD
jgi:hypothetical protein